MPYIKQEDRAKIDPELFELIGAIDQAYPDGAPAGVLNYIVTRLMLNTTRKLSYARINELVGMLSCAQAEYYRRVATSYENQKITDHGDVYP